jgi:hypothetical protein
MSDEKPDFSNVTPEAIQDAMQGDKLINAIKEIVKDKGQMDKMMKDSAKKLTPEFMQKITEMTQQQSEAGPDAPPINQDMLKEALKGTNLSSAISTIMNDPSKISSIMEESVGHMTPQMQEQAKKMASSGQIGTVMKEMQRQGKSPFQMKKEMDAQHKLFKSTQPKPSGPMKKVIVITSSRQVRVKSIYVADIQKVANEMTKATVAVGLPCSRLAVGPLYGKQITVWYDEKNPTKNKRASKLIGYTVGGEVMIVMESGDLDETTFIESEDLIE